jgi:hypothetical protein
MPEDKIQGLTRGSRTKMAAYLVYLAIFGSTIFGAARIFRIHRKKR